jgi:pimeloyl-ACP methyl ester carboxylesterase
MLPSGAQFFCGDLSAQEQREVWAVHNPPDANLFNLKIGRTAWKNKPSWYVLTTKDHTVRPELQRFLADRMGANVIEADSSHVAMLSKPNLVADVIIKAASSVHQSFMPHDRSDRRGPALDRPLVSVPADPG